MRLKYIKDENNNDILTDEHEIYQVMMEWEKTYMENSIKIFNPFGKVLEIGFGMGYSASEICKNKNVKEYNVIECSPTVWDKFYEWKKEQRDNLKINLIKGRWQDILQTLSVFDCIYFDDYINDYSNSNNNRFNHFLFEILLYHSKIGTKICCYSTNNFNIKIDKLNIENNIFDIEIPKNCKYAKGNKMYIPIITVLDEIKKEEIEKKLLFNKNLNLEIEKKIEKAKNYYSSPKNIYCNLLIIDNFYTNADETRNYILKQDFNIEGNYPGKRTISYATKQIKDLIESFIENFAGKITEWPEGGDNYNGAYQYTTSRDRTWIHTDSHNNWAGVLYLTPNAPISSGTGIFKFKDGTRYEEEKDIRGNKQIIDNYSQDYTKWELVDMVGNIYNRLVLFNSKQFHASLDYFGTNKENGRLFQVFFFSTEK